MKTVAQKKRSILFVTPFMETGGTERVIFDLASGLVAKGWDIYVLSSGGRLVQEINNLGATHFEVPSLGSKSPWAIFASARVIRNVIRKHRVGVINSHSYVSAVSVALSQSIPIKNCKHLFTLHIPERQYYFRVMGFTLNRLVDQTCTVCNWTREKLIKAGVSATNIAVIYNGVNTDYFRPTTEKIEKRQHFNITVVARLVERKGHAVLLRAVKRLFDYSGPKNLQLHFYGDGPARLKLEELSETLGLKDFVIFHGDTPDVRTAYKNSDLFVLPSYSEGLPLTILESMSACVPVVTTTVNGIPEVIKHGETGITFSPGDDNALSHIIAEMMDNAELRTKLVRKAHFWVCKNLDTKKMVVQYDRLFLSLLEYDK